MPDAECPVCGKVYQIPEGRGREMVISKFLDHKDHCQLPAEDEYVRLGGRVGVVVEVKRGRTGFPRFEVQLPSGRNRHFSASEVVRFEDQEEGRRLFYE